MCGRKLWFVLGLALAWAVSDGIIRAINEDPKSERLEAEIDRLRQAELSVELWIEALKFEILRLRYELKVHNLSSCDDEFVFFGGENV